MPLPLFSAVHRSDRHVKRAEFYYRTHGNEITKIARAAISLRIGHLSGNNQNPPMIHRDIGSANVLLWQQGFQWRAKVSDFGSANFVNSIKTKAPGNPFYGARGSKWKYLHTTKVRYSLPSSLHLCEFLSHSQCRGENYQTNCVFSAIIYANSFINRRKRYIRGWGFVRELHEIGGFWSTLLNLGPISWLNCCCF